MASANLEAPLLNQGDVHETGSEDGSDSSPEECNDIESRLMFSIEDKKGSFHRMQSLTMGNEDHSFHKVFRAWPTLCKALLWLGVAPDNPRWDKRSSCLYLMYRILVLPGAFLVAVPYAWYQYAWFGVHTGTLNRVMISIHASAPLLAWVQLYKYLRSDHCVQIFLPMLKHYASSEDVQNMKAKMKYHVLWTAMLVCVYFNFTGRSMAAHWSDWSQDGAYGVVKKIVTTQLVITFVYRTFTPLALLSVFQMLIALHERVVDDVVILRSRTKIEALNKQIMQSMAWRGATQDEWGDKFVVLILVPLVEIGLFVFSLWKEEASLFADYLEVFYVAFCVRVAFIILHAASDLTSRANDVRFTILDKIINCESHLHGSSMQHDAFMWKTMHHVVGFRLFGVEISRDTVKQALNVFGVMLAPVALKGLREVQEQLVFFNATTLE